MDNYKQALDKAVEYIMQSDLDYCPLCVNYAPCHKQFEIYARQGKEYRVDRKLCKDSVRQYFLKQAEADND